MLWNSCPVCGMAIIKYKLYCIYLAENVYNFVDLYTHEGFKGILLEVLKTSMF